MNNPNVKATHSWDNLAEKEMREYGVDFRPPSDPESWFWRMDNAQFGSDGQWLPNAENLPRQRGCLFLEYLPNARRITSEINRKLALEVLAGAQSIPEALVVHGDQQKHNLLITGRGRVVWVDFDRADVMDEVNDEALFWFKRDLINVHEMLFIESKRKYGKPPKILRRD
jgi:thiamine kinase-like enzyme